MNVLRRPGWVAAVVLIVGTALAGVAATWQARDNEATARLRFEPIGQRTVTEIADRMQRFEYGLRGLRGAATVIGPDMFGRDELRRYMGTRDMLREFSGVLSMGYIRRVAPGADEAFVADRKRDGADGFRISEMAPNPGERFVIVGSVLPTGTESAVLGLDIASDPARRAAALASMRSGVATLTSPITLSQTPIGSGGAYLLLLPVYRPDAVVGTVAQRESATLAWTYMSLAVEKVLTGIDRADDDISVAIRDLHDGGPQTVFAPGDASAHASDLPRVRVALPVFGRTWQVDVHAEPRFVESLKLRQPRDVLIGGLVLALLAAALAALEARRAERTRVADANQARAAAIVESSTDAVIGESLDGIVTDWNDGAVRLFGYASADAVGRRLADLLLPEGRDSEDASIRAAIRAGERVAPFDTSRRASDGRLIEVSITASPIHAANGRCIGFSKTVRDISEARRAEQALAALNATLEQQVSERVAQLDVAQRESAALLRTLDQLAIVAVTDRSGRITEANDNFCRISGHDHDALIGSTHRIVDSDQQSHAFWVDLWETITSGGAWRGEICNRSKDGSLYWVDSSIAPFVAADGTIEKFVAISIDVTDRKRDELLLSNERFSIAADSAGMGVWEYDVQDRTLVWDDRMSTLYGREPTRGFMSVEVWISSVHPDDRERSQFDLQQAIDGGPPFDTQFRIVRPDGSIRHLKAAAHVARDAHGVAWRLTGVNIDVTERVNAEVAQSLSESLLRRVGHLADVGGWRVDLRDRIVQWSAQTRLIHEVPDDFVATVSNGAAFYDGDARVTIAAAFRRASTTGEGWDCELPFTTFTGRRIWVRSIGEAEFEGGRPVHLTGALQNITARRRADEQLHKAIIKAEAANQAKSLFLANMSHEIRTPMNAVVGLTYLMERTSLDAAQSDMLAKIKLASNSLLTLINDVLDLSKIEASEMRIEQAPFALDQVLSNLSSILRAQAEAKGIGFDIDVPADLPPVLRGDATRVQQVLTNLLANAIKFTETGGVRLMVRRVGASVEPIRLRFVTHDSGIGIAADALDGLFTPFVQADASTTRRFGGSGLGLSIVKQLVTLMGGKFGASSTLQAGSDFWVELTFPVGDVLDEPVSPGVRRKGAGLRGVRLLVVDDSPINLEVAMRVLEGEGAVVQVAQNGQEAIDLLAAAPRSVDLVVMDVQMPVMDGLDATRWIRAHPTLARLPVIALTAGSLTSEQCEAEVAGVNAFIGKPLEPEKLVHIIRRFVKVDEVGSTEASAVASTHEGWPTVDGIDTAAASRCLGGNVPLFRSMLKRMLDEFADVAVAPEGDAAALATLGSRMHRLAGSSATLGALDLMRHCSDAEAACRRDDTVHAAALTRLVIDRSRRLQTAAAAVIESLAPTPLPALRPPRPLARGDLDGLVGLLNAFDLEASTRFADMEPQLRWILGEGAYASMHDQIDNLQFADAADTLTALEP